MPQFSILSAFVLLLTAPWAFEQETVTKPQEVVESQENRGSSSRESGVDSQSSAPKDIDSAKNSDWIQLFNGKDLTGWTPKIRGHQLGENYGNTFRVIDGCLSVSYDQYTPQDSMSMDGRNRQSWEKFGHLFYDKVFSHYILRAEYRFVGEQVANGPGWAFRNNGLMLHGQKAADMTKMQSFPISIEVQLLGGAAQGERPTLNLCTPGTNVEVNGKVTQRHCISSSSKTYRGDQWVSVEVEVRGDRYLRHKINGETVLEYQKPQYDPRDAKTGGSYGGEPALMQKLIKDGNLLIDRGTISIQSESHPIQFRKIELKLLDPANDK